MRRTRKLVAAAMAGAMVFGLGGCGQTTLSQTSEPIEFMSVDAQAQIVNLKTQGMTDPLGIDAAAPSFSWQMQSDVVGAAQKAYQIVVTDPSGATVWDSGVVESSASNEIVYEGEELQPATKYTWTVSVTDTGDNTVESEPAYFETGLMSESFDAWDGAEWIGAPELQLDAASCCVFNISAGVQIPEGSTSASLIFGADDFRLNNRLFNVDMQEGENYVRLELDISGVNENGGAKINAYRMGYFEGDTPDTPVMTIEENESLDSLINASNMNEMHELTVRVSASSITFAIDGTELEKAEISVNNLGGDSSYNTFPNLASIGFAADAGQQAVFTDYRVENGGSYGSGTLFGEDTGATYEIFSGMDGVSVSGNTITVNGGSSGVLGYADPSYGAAPMLRTGFEVKPGVASARLYLTAQGIYNFYMNGQEVAADEWFNPGASEYDAELGYNTYDVTEYLAEGENAMGAVLGEGWWTGQMTYEASNSNYFGDQPALMAKLVVNYEDGSSDIIVTDDASWKYYNDGPVRYASFFQGERYDATKEAAVAGWNAAGFDDSAWQASAVIETRPAFSNVRLVTRYDEPVHVIRTNEATALGASKEGENSYIYDMGENVSGVPVITIPDEYAKAGETVTVRFAESLYPELEEYTEKGLDGLLMVENYRAAMVTDFYTMKESGNVIAPDLTFHGYRYIEITGLDEELPAECVQMQVLSSVDATGSYTSSNELANQLYRNITNSTTSNYISIPTDCPQRNERMGWTGDAQIFALSGSYVADTYNFMDQWMNSVRADSGETGMSSQYSPAFVAYEPGAESIEHTGQSFGITWNALAVTVPYNQYIQTGRLEIVEENIDNIYAYMDTLMTTPFEYKDPDGEKVEDERLTGETGTLADHLSRVSTDSPLLGNALYIACLDESAIMADAIGDAEKADAFREAAADARDAWNEIFIDPDTGKTRNAEGEVQDTQASYATPLRFGVVNDKNLEKVTENYNKSIAEASGEDMDGVGITPYTLTTGFNATGNLLNALSDNGLNDTAYKLFESTDYASWLYPVTEGATSIWERWNSYTEEGGFNGNNSMNSFNHYSYGAVCEWMLGYQAGIIADKNLPGYQNFILQPTVGGTFTELTGSYDSVYGTITSGWTAEEGQMTSYDVTVPANTAATLYLPVSADEVNEIEGITHVGSETHNGIETEKFEVMAGTWHFDIQGGSITISQAEAPAEAAE